MPSHFYRSSENLKQDAICNAATRLSKTYWPSRGCQSQIDTTLHATQQKSTPFRQCKHSRNITARQTVLDARVLTELVQVSTYHLLKVLNLKLPCMHTNRSHRAVNLFAARNSVLYSGSSAGEKSDHSSPVTYRSLTPAVTIKTGNDRKERTRTALVKPSLPPLTGASKMKADVTNNP